MFLLKRPTHLIHRILTLDKKICLKKMLSCSQKCFASCMALKHDSFIEDVSNVPFLLFLPIQTTDCLTKNVRVQIASKRYSPYVRMSPKTKPPPPVFFQKDSRKVAPHFWGKLFYNVK
jgi:hypothetical protein